MGLKNLTAVDILTRLLQDWPGIDPNADDLDIEIDSCSDVISDISTLLAQWSGT